MGEVVEIGQDVFTIVTKLSQTKIKYPGDTDLGKFKINTMAYLNATLLSLLL